METVQIERRKDQETRKAIDSLLSSYSSKESKRYWLNVMVKANLLSSSRAGQIIMEKGLI